MGIFAVKSRLKSPNIRRIFAKKITEKKCDYSPNPRLFAESSIIRRIRNYLQNGDYSATIRWLGEYSHRAGE